MSQSNFVIDLTVDSDSQDTPRHEPQDPNGTENTKCKKNKRSKEKQSRRRQIGDFLRDRAPHAHRKSFYVSNIQPNPMDATAVVLADPSTQLFNTTFLDRGWACGYRNCQMMLSSLITRAAQWTAENSRFPDKVPSVRSLQEALEFAWRDGFDLPGAEQLGRYVVGTRKWIGTTEIYCILAHYGVQARIVDFHSPTAPDGTHPMLFAWIVDYFTKAEQGGPRHPLYLQHQGHSRTVVGVELAESSTNLLVFDPDVAPASDKLAAFRFLLRQTRGIPQYQILYVDDIAANSPTGSDHIAKDIASARIP
ncbi:hypothetical protein GGI07_001715 [Coemansia sp. Benny D115]|nr:hypothetical protein GGI07_001715 [Coemansia sp. Benny D115]